METTQKKIADLSKGDNIANKRGQVTHQVIANDGGMLYLYDYNTREFYAKNRKRHARHGASVLVVA